MNRVTVWTVLLISLTLVACSEVKLVLRATPTVTPTPLPATPTPESTPVIWPTLSPPLVTNLSVTAHIPARIIAPSIELDAPVVEMDWQTQVVNGQISSEWQLPPVEAGWHRNSARLGESSNIVISGHNNSMGGRVFAAVEDLAVGETITLYDEQAQSFSYQVTEREVIRVFAASQEMLDRIQTLVSPTTTEQLTLVTCWPSWSNTHRVIVIAKPIERSSSRP